ncbi:gfo/Idh/MocA family oxidoreductase [Flagellimonas taeanensis]|uniref:Gfo/Idh/MocA family protein n=1 Tax=Flavobacteriaceae TaxID=49546 RepID=UPI000E68A4BE|nr:MULTISPECIES: Gfo/Idh/MocA family oxidoreductase [Allomuricauda]MDC6386552.1 Gfo/Idh/MocA family oxidoreductase [Muricauda sp. SK9]RIV51277.1 gfo/Idh/MocA family oxidoreductase [Allomuricauda taeanensis]
MGTRRNFVGTTLLAGLGLGLTEVAGSPLFKMMGKGKRVGIIGLDTSHAPAFTKMLNADEPSLDFMGYKVVAAYPWGSKDIESSRDRIPKFTEEVATMGVHIAKSIDEVMDQVDVVLLETHDGNLRLKQAKKILKYGKPVFMDTPFAASMPDIKTIVELSEKYGTPIFSASSLRYTDKAMEIAEGKVVGKVMGASTYGPANIEPSHPDLFWYGIHGVELLYTLMGTGCETVNCISTDATEVVTGVWKDGRLGTFRGERQRDIGFGGMAFGENGNALVGEYKGYRPLLVKIIDFFETGIAPVSPQETMEIYAFMQAAHDSKRQGGEQIPLDSVY